MEKSFQEKETLVGAFHFLESFGKEMKPKKYFLVGLGEAGKGFLEAVGRGGPLWGKVKGLALTCFPRYNGSKNEEIAESLKKLSCPVLFLGERDPEFAPEKWDTFQNSYSVRVELYGPGNPPGNGPKNHEILNPPGGLQNQEIKIGKTEVILNWLNELDLDRENFRR